MSPKPLASYLLSLALGLPLGLYLSLLALYHSPSQEAPPPLGLLGPFFTRKLSEGGYLSRDCLSGKMTFIIWGPVPGAKLLQKNLAKRYCPPGALPCSFYALGSKAPQGWEALEEDPSLLQALEASSVFSKELPQLLLIDGYLRLQNLGPMERGLDSRARREISKIFLRHSLERYLRKKKAGAKTKHGF